MICDEEMKKIRESTDNLCEALEFATALFIREKKYQKSWTGRISDLWALVRRYYVSPEDLWYNNLEHFKALIENDPRVYSRNRQFCLGRDTGDGVYRLIDARPPRSNEEAYDHITNSKHTSPACFVVWPKTPSAASCSAWAAMVPISTMDVLRLTMSGNRPLIGTK